MTQKEIILDMLKSKEWVSTVDAVKIYVLRLGAIIYDLKKEGYEIESRRVENKDYQEYRLLKTQPTLL